jgi:hypothetical protein
MLLRSDQVREHRPFAVSANPSQSVGDPGVASATAQQDLLQLTAEIHSSISAGIYPARTDERLPLSLASVISTPALTLTGENMGNFFGRLVATAGDVSGDGYSDLIVGASRFDNNRGRAYLYLGVVGGLSPAPVLTMSGEYTGDLYGIAVSTAGDVNGDGYADVIVGASVGGTGTGRAYLYLGGSAGLSQTPVVTLTGEHVDDAFGATVTSAGDVNDDGYGDIIVGAFQFPNGNSTGRAYVYMGWPGGLTVTPAVTLTGEFTGDGFSIPVATAGDVNGDGYTDVIIGAPNNGSVRGRAYVYLGGPGGLGPTPALTLTGEHAGYAFGFGLATAGDVNGDGYADVVVGAQGYAGFGSTGRAYLFMGGPSGLSATPALTLTGEGNNDSFGNSVATAGDVNDDGYTDIIIGARNYSGGAGTGRACLFLGGPAGLSSTPALTLTGENSGNFLGRRAVQAGDVNGDGYSDLVIAADGYSSNTGRVYIFLGGAEVLSSTQRLYLPLIKR